MNVELGGDAYGACWCTLTRLKDLDDAFSVEIQLEDWVRDAAEEIAAANWQANLTGAEVERIIRRHKR